MRGLILEGNLCLWAQVLFENSACEPAATSETSGAGAHPLSLFNIHYETE